MISPDYRVLRTVAGAEVFCFIAFAVLCWVSEAFTWGRLERQYLQPCIVIAVLTFFCSLVLWRSHRKVAVAGLLSLVVFAVWLAIPRHGS